jgi:hypothetical protein
MKRALMVFTFTVLAVVLVFAGGSGQKGGQSSGGPAEISVEVFDRGTGVDATKNNWTDWIQKKLLED